MPPVAAAATRIDEHMDQTKLTQKKQSKTSNNLKTTCTQKHFKKTLKTHTDTYSTTAGYDDENHHQLCKNMFHGTHCGESFNQKDFPLPSCLAKSPWLPRSLVQKARDRPRAPQRPGSTPHWGRNIWWHSSLTNFFLTLTVRSFKESPKIHPLTVKVRFWLKIEAAAVCFCSKNRLIWCRDSPPGCASHGSGPAGPAAWTRRWWESKPPHSKSAIRNLACVEAWNLIDRGWGQVGNMKLTVVKDCKFETRSYYYNINQTNVGKAPRMLAFWGMTRTCAHTPSCLVASQAPVNHKGSPNETLLGHGGLARPELSEFEHRVARSPWKMQPTKRRSSPMHYHHLKRTAPAHQWHQEKKVQYLGLYMCSLETIAKIFKDSESLTSGKSRKPGLQYLRINLQTVEDE